MASVTNSEQTAAVSVGEAAQRLGISRASFYRLLSVPGFPSLKLGGRRLIPLAALDAWLAAELERQAAERQERTFGS